MDPPTNIGDSAVVHENKRDQQSPLLAPTGVLIDLVKESSDAFGPLKSVVGGLSAILKYYEAGHCIPSKHFQPLTFEPANEGES